MTFDFEIIENSGILQVEYSGDIDLHTYITERENLLKIIETNRSRKVLILMGKTFLDCEIIDILSLVTEIPYFFPKGLRIALVSPDCDYYRYRLFMAELICFNYGFDLRVFADYDVAVRWLSAGRLFSSIPK